MATPNAIYYELGLTVVAALGFWVWQTWDLRRAKRERQAKEAADGLAALADEARHPAKPGPPPRD